MALTSGSRLGPYEIAALIGSGGMGEVYRARDTRLNRDVALKVLPELFAADPDRLARFRREAQLLASLNHPNIAAIYGFEEGPTGVGAGFPGPPKPFGGEGGSRPVSALVLELVEGPTLADRIAQGPMPPDEALPIARQIAEALEAAHELGIIHRDMKPANIKVRPDGMVKVLDFGLARAFEPDVVGAGFSRPDLSASPTITSPAATRAGVILGTAAYMSPEQARGKPVDKRSDIWAFGCVLYEMLTGRRVFAGDDVADVLVAVLSKEPAWEALPSATPPAVRRLLRRSLERDRRRRLADISDARLDLEDAAAVPAIEVQGAPAPVAHRQRWLPAALAAALAASIAGISVWMARPGITRPVARFVIPLPPDQELPAGPRSFVAVSADGSRIAYAANLRMYLRSMDQLNAVPIPGTEGSLPTAPRDPFFSPDGQWLGFWHDGQIKRVSVAGGTPVALARAVMPSGASWSDGDVIVYGLGLNGIWRVPASGGTPEQVVKMEPGQSAASPQLLPGGRALLFTMTQDESEAQIVVQTLADGARRVVVTGGTDARYLPTGHLVYMAEGTVLAVRLDLETLTADGAPVPVLEDVARSVQRLGAAQFAVSAGGTLVYAPASSLAANAARRLVWVDRAGRETAIPAPPRGYLTPAVSPDGARLAFSDGDGDFDIWIYEFRRGIFERLTADRTPNRLPVWSPDGRRVAFSVEGAEPGVFVRNADGTGNAERLTAGRHIPQSWSRDGSRLVFLEFGTEPLSGVAPTDLGIVTTGAEPRVEPFVVAPGRQDLAQIAPGGQWIAYVSTEPGESAVFVRPFPDVSGGRWRISSGPGTKPVWARDGRTLFYGTGQAMMAVAVLGATPAEWGAPQKLFEGVYDFSFAGPTFDVAPDGRFVMIKQDTVAGTGMPDTLIVVQNWHEELKRLVPVN